MTRTIKKWAGIALPIVILSIFLLKRNAEDSRMKSMWERKYRRTRMQIGWQLMNLRHEYSTQRIHVSQNTALEIRKLWDERDVLFHVLNKKKSPFPADSLIELERLIDRKASLVAVFREIERVEKMNEAD